MAVSERQNCPPRDLAAPLPGPVGRGERQAVIADRKGHDDRLRSGPGQGGAPGVTPCAVRRWVPGGRRGPPDTAPRPHPAPAPRRPRRPPPTAVPPPPSPS